MEVVVVERWGEDGVSVEKSLYEAAPKEKELGICVVFPIWKENNGDFHLSRAGSGPFERLSTSPTKLKKFFERASLSISRKAM